jgi:uncharacterized protein YutE (UPF0331/DUF86 family)
VVLRPESIRQRLLKLEGTVSGLEEILTARRASPASALIDGWAAERGLQVGAETILDIGNHILTAHFGVSPQDYEDIITQLGTYGVIDPELQGRLKGLGGFRNVLVHGYLRIDPSRVDGALQRAPVDFRDFGRTIRRWLDANTPTTP